MHMISYRDEPKINLIYIYEMHKTMNIFHFFHFDLNIFIVIFVSRFLKAVKMASATVRRYGWNLL
jgi:hypothetical protein